MLDWMCLDNNHYCKGESFYKNQISWGLQSPLILKTQHAFTTSIMNQHILMIQKDTSFLFFKKKIYSKVILCDELTVWYGSLRFFKFSKWFMYKMCLSISRLFTNMVHEQTLLNFGLRVLGTPGWRWFCITFMVFVF